MTNQTINKFIYLPIYLSDYVSQSRKLTMLQRGAFIDLSVLYFQENLKLNYQKEQIYRLVFAFEKEEREAVDFILDNYFIKSENKPTGFYWVSSELDEIGDKVLKRLNASRENGKLGGRGNKKENKPTGSNLLNLEKSILNETKLNETKLNENKVDLKEINSSNNINIKNKRFTKPTIQELTSFCNEFAMNIDPQQFIDYYDANGWKINKNPMKDWQATARNWHRRNADKITTTKKSNVVDPMDFVPSYDYEF